jgi:hypothetical protein
MVALAASLAAAAALGLTGWVPALLQQDTGVTSVQPSRLTVTAAARGAATLGDGYTVGLSSAGFRYAKGDVVMADTVTRGAPVIALLGSLTGPADEPREDIADTLDRITFTDLEVGRDGASWHGRIEGEVEGRPRGLPVTWAVSRTGDRIDTTITVKGADGLVVPLDWRPAVTGIEPSLPARNLRLKSWWFRPEAPADRAFTWALGTTIGAGPATAARSVDLTVDGRVDLHVWSPTVELHVTGPPVAPPKTSAN